MDWIQFATLFVTFVGLFIWNRTESRSDARHMDQKLDSSRQLFLEMQRENQRRSEENQKENQRRFEEHQKESQKLLEEHRRETWSLIEAIRQDIKDFHGRLCSIEERYRTK